MKKVSTSKLPTTGRIGRIAKFLLTEIGETATKKILKNAGVFNELNSVEKADYIRAMVKRMKQVIGVAKTYNILVSCGRKCCGATTRNRAVEIMRRSKSLKDFIIQLNKQSIGGGRLKIKNKCTITGGYDQCYCGIVNQTKIPFKDTTYCQCSTGWYKQLFETALGCPVEVKILQSIISGAETCEFEIRISR